jgi:flavin-dependent dehydrogenase
MDCTSSAVEQQAPPRHQPLATVDITVVGAGPAGAFLAYLLAARGLRVLLVEKARLPRVKPCGGGLNHKTVALLPFSLAPVQERVVSRVLFTQHLRRPFLRTYPEPLVTGEGIYYAVRSAHLAAEAIALASLEDASPVAYEAAVDAEIMPELSGARALQQIFDAYPWLFYGLVRCHQRSWRALAKILRGERSFADVERVLRRYPALVPLVLWARRGVFGQQKSRAEARPTGDTAL